MLCIAIFPCKCIPNLSGRNRLCPVWIRLSEESEEVATLPINLDSHFCGYDFLSMSGCLLLLGILLSPRCDHRLSTSPNSIFLSCMFTNRPEKYSNKSSQALRPTFFDFRRTHWSWSKTDKNFSLIQKYEIQGKSLIKVLDDLDLLGYD